MATNDSRSLGELFTDLSRDTSNLVRQEVLLAKTEMTEKAVAAGKGAALFVVAGVFTFFAVEAFLAAAIVGLATVIPAWAAALAVGVTLFLAGGLFALVGVRKSKKAANPLPEQTIETLKEDVRWAQRQLT